MTPLHRDRVLMLATLAYVVLLAVWTVACTVMLDRTLT